MTGSLEAKSKFLALVLRHRPESVDLDLDADGWVDLAALIDKCAQRKIEYSQEIINQIIAASDVARFELSDDGERIRATHGHSVEVNIEHLRAVPPALLFHGTAPRFISAIRAEGLTAQGRRHVHLSATPPLAVKVGMRHVASPDDVIVLSVDAGAMTAAGQAFFQSGSGVWLTEAVAPSFISFDDGEM